MYISLLHSAYQSTSTWHRCTIAFGSGASLSDAMGGKRSKVCEAKHRNRGSSSSSNSSRIVDRHGHHTSFLQHCNSNFNRDVTDVIQRSE